MQDFMITVRELQTLGEKHTLAPHWFNAMYIVSNKQPEEQKFSGKTCWTRFLSNVV
jgi:hypothetical protein